MCGLSCCLYTETRQPAQNPSQNLHSAGSGCQPCNVAVRLRIGGVRSDALALVARTGGGTRIPTGQEPLGWLRAAGMILAAAVPASLVASPVTRCRRVSGARMRIAERELIMSLCTAVPASRASNGEQQPLDFLQPRFGFLFGEARKFAAELDEIAVAREFQFIGLDFDAGDGFLAGENF